MKKAFALFFILTILIAAAAPAFAAPNVGFGQLYYDDTVVRTVVPPAAMTKEGLDSFYAVPGQMAVVGVAPGDTDYHGGKWAWHTVTWNVEPYPLTSEQAVLDAADNGDISITREVEKDFKCPIQP